MGSKKITVMESPVIAADKSVIAKKKKSGAIEYKTMKFM